MSIKTVLAALSLGSENDPVIGRAIQLAEQHNARLIVIHVIEGFEHNHQDLALPANEDELRNTLNNEATVQIKRLLKGSPINAEISVKAGRPYQVIEELRSNHDPELVIVGNGRARNMREKIFGSTADRIVRSNKCPVLVVKNQAGGEYRRLAGAVDFSPLSIAAARFAARLAPTATIDLVHAVEISLIFEQAMLKAGTPPPEIQQYRKEKTRDARRKLHMEITKAGAFPASTRIRTMQGAPAETLVRLANRGSVELVALGAQGRNAISSLVQGSVTRKVLGAATCDVLVTPPTSALTN